ncbi:MAG: imelysin family protein [Rhizobiaceae bacterium]
MRTALVAILLAATVPAHAENATIRNVIDGFVRPAYADFAATTTNLETRAGELCTAPSQVSLKAARAAFRDAARAWSVAETVRFGPVTEETRLERILFWPDRKSIGLKQVQRALAEEDPTAIDATALTKKSVAMQGFGALEFTLFGAGADDLAAGAAYRCAYASAIATNLAGMAETIASAWAEEDGIVGLWANPGPDNPLFREDAEAMTELLDVAVHGLELVRDVRLGGFLADKAEDDRPKQALFWRSEMTVAAIRADLDGMRTLFEAADFGTLIADDMDWLPGSVAFEFANAARALDGLDGPVEAMLADPERRGRLEYLAIVTSGLSDTIGGKLAPALGLTSGFSSLDGD